MCPDDEPRYMFHKKRYREEDMRLINKYEPENYPDGDYDYEDVCQWQEQAIADKDKLLADKDKQIADMQDHIDNLEYALDCYEDYANKVSKILNKDESKSYKFHGS